jgi:membrane-bound serine protease (ClpP class)
VATLVGGFVALSPSAHAEVEVEVVDLPGIDVVQINGLVDPPNASLLIDAIESAETRGSTLLVIQLDSGGAVDVDLWRLYQRINTAKVPIVVWIGPAGASARGASAQLATAGSYLSMASNAKIGPCSAFTLDGRPPPVFSLSPGRLSPFDCLLGDRINAKSALAQGVADSIDPALRNLLFALDGKTLASGAGGSVEISTRIVDPGSDEPSLNQDLRFQKLSIGGQVLHTLNAPWVAFFLFVAGMALIVFELYAASVGAAAIVGAIALICAFTGFSHLPVNWLGLGLLTLGLLGLTIDLQAGGVGFWSGFGVLAMIAGSVFLYDGSSRLDPPWWTIALVILGTVAFFAGGLPAMLRTRFSTPTIGREGIIGEMGTAEVDVNPEGVVRVRDALWKARVNRATPIKAGAPVRVVAVEGLALEVEPESGGAEDYRERARKRKP